MKKKFAMNTASSLLLQMVTLICGFVLPRVILEQYGSEVNGLTQSVKQFLGIITFLELGVGQVIQSSLYKPLADKDSRQISCVLASGERFFRRIAGVLFVYALILMAAYPILVDQSFGWAYTAALIGAISIGSFAQYYFGLVDNLLLNADQRGYVQYFSQIAVILLNTVVSVWMIRKGASIQSVKLMSSLLFLGRPLLVRHYVRRHYQIQRRIRYEGEPIRQKWNGIAQHVSAVVLEGTDNIVLTLFSTLTNVSIYSVYYMVIHGIMQLYTSATAGIQSAVGTLWARQEREKLQQVFGFLETGLHFAVVFLFSCTGILMIPFVRVYTDGLTDANYVQPVFSLVLVSAYAIRCLRTPYNILILAGGHFKQTQKCHIVAAALNLGISIAAVSAWGLVGIAVGTLAAITYQTVWMAVYNSKHLLCWPLRSVMKQTAVDILTAGMIWLGTAWIHLESVSYLGWFAMAVKVAVTALGITAAMAVIFYRSRLVQLWRLLEERNR